MKIIGVIVCVFGLVGQCANAATLSKSQCAKMAEATQQGANGVSQFIDLLEQVEPQAEDVILGRSAGVLKSAAEHTRTARLASLVPAKAYRDALQDLAYQLQVCAR